MAECGEWARKAMAETAAESIAMAGCLGYLAQADYFRGRWDEAIGWAERAIDVARRLGTAATLAFGTHDLANGLHGRGDLADAARAARESLEHCRAGGVARTAVLARAVLVMIEADRGAGDRERPDADALVRDADALRDFFLRARSRHAVLHQAVQRQDARAGERVADELLGLIREHPEHRLIRVLTGGLLAEALLAAGRRDEAMRLASETAASARASGAWHHESVAHRVRARILLEDGRLDEAAPLYDAAVAALEAAGSRLELGRTLSHRARLHAARHDARRAKADRAKARAIFATCGAADG